MMPDSLLNVLLATGVATGARINFPREQRGRGAAGADSETPRHDCSGDRGLRSLGVKKNMASKREKIVFFIFPD